MRRLRIRRIRSLIREPEMLPRRIHDRRERYQKMLNLTAPQPILDLFRSSWHDAEYALSIVEGYYDPTSEINRFVLRETRQEGGFEMVYADLERLRREILTKIHPCVSKYCVPEYGAVMRFCRANGLGKKRKSHA